MTKKNKSLTISRFDLDIPVVIRTQLAELLILESLLCDVSMGILPSVHCDEKHHSFYSHFADVIHEKIWSVLNDKEK